MPPNSPSKKSPEELQVHPSEAVPPLPPRCASVSPGLENRNRAEASSAKEILLGQDCTDCCQCRPPASNLGTSAGGTGTGTAPPWQLAGSSGASSSAGPGPSSLGQAGAHPPGTASPRVTSERLARTGGCGVGYVGLWMLVCGCSVCVFRKRCC